LGDGTVQPKSLNQRRYLDAIESHDMVFGIVRGNREDLSRSGHGNFGADFEAREPDHSGASAVEAGERLGFLPGNVAGEN